MFIQQVLILASSGPVGIKELRYLPRRDISKVGQLNGYIIIDAITQIIRRSPFWNTPRHLKPDNTGPSVLALTHPLENGTSQLSHWRVVPRRCVACFSFLGYVQHCNPSSCHIHLSTGAFTVLFIFWLVSTIPHLRETKHYTTTFAVFAMLVQLDDLVSRSANLGDQVYTCHGTHFDHPGSHNKCLHY